MKEAYRTGLLYAAMLLGAAGCSYLPATRGSVTDLGQKVAEASKEISGLKDRTGKIEQKPLAERTVLILKGTGYDNELKDLERPVYRQISEKCGSEEISIASEYGGMILKPTVSGDSKINLFKDRKKNNIVDYGLDEVYQCSDKNGNVIFSFIVKKDEKPKRVKELMIDIKSVK